MGVRTLQQMFGRWSQAELIRYDIYMTAYQVLLDYFLDLELYNQMWRGINSSVTG